MRKLLLYIVATTVLCTRVLSQDVLQMEEQAHQLMGKNKTTEAIDKFSKVAQVYWNRQDFDNAIRVFELLMEHHKRENNHGAIFSIANNLGLLYSNTGDYSKSLNSFLLTLEISKKQKSKLDIVSSQINVASTLQAAGNYEASFTYLNEAIPLATEIGEMKILRRVYGLVAQYYEKKGESERAFEYFEKYAAIDKAIKTSEMDAVKREALTKVTVANQEKASTLLKLDKTALQLKETEDSLKDAERLARDRKLQIDLRNMQLREKESQIKYEQKVRKILVISMLVVCVFVIVLVFLFVDRVKANKLLNQKNREIEAQKNEIITQQEKLSQQHKNIRASITYAQTIQNAALPDVMQLCPFMDTGLLFRPKDIVSGDFYWNHNISPSNTIIAVVDCTGHGVPGAFMSLVGVQLLNEIVIGNKIDSPCEILSRLNALLMKVLKQDITENEDGMDLCVCNIKRTSEQTCDVIFAGAKRPLYLFSKATGSVSTIDGASFSTGGRYSKKSNVCFNNTGIKMQKGDVIVLTSDGAIDQPGANRKRFGSLRLMETIRKGAENDATSNELVQLLCENYDTYTTGEDQRDDLTVLFLKC